MGSMAVVAGRLQIRDWQDKEGNKRRNAEIVVENIYFGESEKSDSAKAERPRYQPAPCSDSDDTGLQYQPSAHFGSYDEDDGDLPF